MFTLITQIFHEEEIPIFVSLGLKEVILEPKLLARRGKLSLTETQHLIHQCHKWNLRVSLQWDILCEVQQLPTFFNFLQQLPFAKIHAFRIQDPGIAYWFVSQQFPSSLHLICENGNHNFVALQQWEKIFQPVLKKLILSSEIPNTLLQQWVSQLQVETEILGLGPILLFYSPRKLLSPHFGEAEEIQQWTRSPESKNRDFLTLENTHGSFLYHTKDLCLFDFIPDLIRTKVQWIRLDRHEQKDCKLIRLLLSLLENPTQESLQTLKSNWKKALTAGFFRVNRTDASFDRLKNSHLDTQKNPPCAEILEVQKRKHILLFLFEPMKRGDSFFFVTTEKQKKPFILHTLQNSAGNEVEFLEKDTVAILPWAGRIPATTFVWRDTHTQEVS